MCSVRFPTIAACLLLAAGCSLPQPLPSVSSLTVPDDSVVVVGKIQLDPAFDTEREQQTYWNVLGDGAIRDRVLIATGSTPSPVEPGRFSGQAWQGYIDAQWNEYFTVIMPRETRYLNGVAVPLDAMRQEFLWFPGGLVVRPTKDAQVVYIGTLRYVRDDFNQIVNVEVIDERTEAATFLQQRFHRTSVDFETTLWLRQLPWEASNSPE